MKINLQKLGLTFVCLATLMTGCATTRYERHSKPVTITKTGLILTKHAQNYNGLTTPHGNATYLSTSKYALHFLFGVFPFLGDATITQTVADFTSAAKEEGASQVRIVQSNKNNWWFIFPPFTFLLTPVSANVAGDIIR